MREQHGQELDRTRLERITYAVGDAAEAYLAERRRMAEEIAASPERTTGGDQLVLTADGGGIPCGELKRPAPAEAQEKTPVRGLPVGTRTIAKREGRVVLVHQLGVVTERVADLHIDPLNHPEVTGQRIFCSAVLAGLRDNTAIHGVFDMGSWPRTQFDEQFADFRHSSAADLFHVTEYLASAGKVLLDSERGIAWAMQRKNMLLEGKADTVLRSLAQHRCTAACPKDEHGVCLVQVTKRYLTVHKARMNYPEIIAAGLPVGSGEVESAIRHIIRKRMDVAGAWKEMNANRVLALLTISRSGWWDDFWAWCDRKDLAAWRKRQRGELKSAFRGRPRRKCATPAKICGNAAVS